MRLWPFVLTVGFGIVFMAIADLAWLTAIGTSGPWFTSATSAQMYTTTLTTATLATLILASLAASRLAALESAIRAIEGQGADGRDDGRGIPVEINSPMGTRPVRPPKPVELDQILAELERFAEAPAVELRERHGARAVQLAVAPPLQDARAAARFGGPPSTRSAVHRGRRLVWQTVTGPLVLYLIFLSISGAMLPGSNEFAQTHFQLNTGLILFLGYGWPFLVAWTIAAVVVLHVAVRLDRMIAPGSGEPS